MIRPTGARPRRTSPRRRRRRRRRPRSRRRSRASPVRRRRCRSAVSSRSTYELTSESPATTSETERSHALDAMSRSVRSSPRSSRSLQPVEQRARRLRVRRRRDVVRNRRPDRRRREAGAAHRVVQHADDAGRPFVARPLHAEPRREHLVGGRAGALDRARVRRVAEQRAERDDHLAVRRAGDADHVVAERRASAGSARRRAAARGRVRRAGSDPAESASDGQLTVRTTPSTSSTVGRAAWKSRYSSMSSAANGRALRAAREPAHRVGRGVGRVVPAGERGDHRGSVQRRFDAPADGHAFTLGPAPRSALASDDRIAQRADAFDRDLDDVAVDQPAGRRARRADPGRRAGEDDVARLERAALADPRDEVRAPRTRAATCSTTAAPRR